MKFSRRFSDLSGDWSLLASKVKVRVESVRKDVHLRTREKYPGDAAELDPDQTEEFAFSSEGRSAFDATEIGLRVAISRNSSSGTAHFDIAVDPEDVLIERTGESYQGGLVMMLAFYTEGFLKRPSRPMPLDINLTQEQFEKARQDWIHFPQTVLVSDGIQKIRLIVFDRGLHGLGSVTIPTK